MGGTEILLLVDFYVAAAQKVTVGVGGRGTACRRTEDVGAARIRLSRRRSYILEWGAYDHCHTADGNGVAKCSASFWVRARESSDWGAACGSEDVGVACL